MGSRIDCAEPLRWFCLLGRSFQYTEKQFFHISVDVCDPELLQVLGLVFLPGVLCGRAGDTLGVSWSKGGSDSV